MVIDRTLGWGQGARGGGAAVEKLRPGQAYHLHTFLGVATDLFSVQVQATT